MEQEEVIGACCHRSLRAVSSSQGLAEHINASCHSRIILRAAQVLRRHHALRHLRGGRTGTDGGASACHRQGAASDRVCRGRVWGATAANGAPGLREREGKVDGTNAGR